MTDTATEAMTREQLDKLTDDELARHYAGRWAPVQGYTGGIPWEMHMRAYNVYAKKWSKQRALIDLDGKGCRGGFGVGELDEFIPGWREELSERNADRQQIADLQAQVERMREALRPFAAYANLLGEHGAILKDGLSVTVTIMKPLNVPGAYVTVGDLRKAAAVMGEKL